MRALLFGSAVFALVLVSLNARAASSVAAIRYEGLYCARTAEGYTDYLRFYPDGRVVTTVSGNTPAEVARWLRKGYAALGDCEGTYRIRQQNFSARVAVHRGQPGRTGNSYIDYTGTVSHDTLLLRVHSQLTGHSERLRFDFVPAWFGPREREPNHAMAGK